MGLQEFDLPVSCCKRPKSKGCQRAVKKVNINRIPTDRVYAVVREEKRARAIFRLTTMHLQYILYFYTYSLPPRAQLHIII